MKFHLNSNCCVLHDLLYKKNKHVKKNTELYKFLSNVHYTINLFFSSDFQSFLSIRVSLKDIVKKLQHALLFHKKILQNLPVSMRITKQEKLHW